MSTTPTSPDDNKAKPRLTIDDWQDLQGGLPLWLMQAYERKSYAYSDEGGFFSWLGGAAKGLYNVIKITRANARVCEGRLVDEDDIDKVGEAIQHFDIDTLTQAVEKNGIGALVKHISGGGSAVILAEMNKAVALDQTLRVFSSAVFEGKMLLDDLEAKGLDLDKLTAVPVDSEEAKSIVDAMDKDQLDDFKAAAAVNTKWQHILEGAISTEQHVEALLGDRREDAQNISDFGAPNANDYEEAIENWMDLCVRPSSFSWGVVRCKEWPKIVKDFHGQMQWVCNALHAHTDDKETEFLVRRGAMPVPKKS